MKPLSERIKARRSAGKMQSGWRGQDSKGDWHENKAV